MIEADVRIALAGTPAAKGSMKCVGRDGHHQLVPDNKDAQKAWIHDLGAAFKQAVRKLDARIRATPQQPIGVEVTLTIERPQSHYGTGRNAGKLKAGAPQHPATHGTGDVDKLVRLVLDVLQAQGALVDDAQVVGLTTRKAYPTEELEAFTGPKPPEWRPITPDALGHPGAVVRVHPYRGE